MYSLKAYASALKAGWIAGKCIRQGGSCMIDDEAEEIRPCPIHAEKIANLAIVNKEATGG